MRSGYCVCYLPDNISLAVADMPKGSRMEDAVQGRVRGREDGPRDSRVPDTIGSTTFNQNKSKIKWHGSN